MARSQKKIIETYKNATKLTVVSFDPVTEQRIGTYANLDPFTALHEIQHQLFVGRKVVITNEQGDTDMFREEHALKRMINYSEAIKYRTDPDDFLQYWR